ncbi:hypothetical protein [Trinickia dinghuensis]|uniref:Lipoprotein n=1 Tax=Trinickia dinghuensis TaxID=2291023 RepID=A0A3D8JW70_9BURK|nr:hypothetical protein [Trinickia dinghuensis]RDU97307.1 hypothetical protein DWV00_18920 [Trinickia dinghuensis]
MKSSSIVSKSRRIASGAFAFLALALFAGCTSTMRVPPDASASGHAVYGSDSHYGGWGTGFGSDGSRGRG